MIRSIFAVEPIADPYTLPFAPELINYIQEKSKRKSYRFGTKYDYLNIWDTITIVEVNANDKIGTAKVVNKETMPFDQIPLDLSWHASYASREEMRTVFSGYYAYLGRPIQDEDSFLVISFQLDNHNK